jgi:hypothetical protein
MNQYDTERVTRIVLKPLEALYGKYNDEAAKLIIEDLSPYDNATLSEAVRDVRRSVKSFPKIAHLVEYCEKNKPKKEPKVADYQDTEKFHCRGAAEHTHPIQAKEILLTPVGQKALEIGVGRDLLVEYECSGKKDFDDAYVAECKRGLENAVTALEDARKAKNPQLAAYEGLFNAMINREKSLYEKYYKSA